LRLPLLLWLFRRPGVRLAPFACTLRSVRLFRLSRLAPVALNLRLPVAGFPDSHRVLRPQAPAFDRLPVSLVHLSSELASGQLPACAFFWVRLLLQRFLSDRTDSVGNLLPAWARLGPLSMGNQRADRSHRRLIATRFAAIAHPMGWLGGFPTGRPWVSLGWLPISQEIRKPLAIPAALLARTHFLGLRPLRKPLPACS